MDSPNEREEKLVKSIVGHIKQDEWSTVWPDGWKTPKIYLYYQNTPDDIADFDHGVLSEEDRAKEEVKGKEILLYFQNRTK